MTKRLFKQTNDETQKFFLCKTMSLILAAPEIFAFYDLTALLSPPYFTFLNIEVLPFCLTTNGRALWWIYLFRIMRKQVDGGLSPSRKT